MRTTAVQTETLFHQPPRKRRSFIWLQGANLYQGAPLRVGDGRRTVWRRPIFGKLYRCRAAQYLQLLFERWPGVQSHDWRKLSPAFKGKLSFPVRCFAESKPWLWYKPFGF